MAKTEKSDNAALVAPVVEALDDLKGQSITSLDVTQLTAITDHMVIATGTSNTHVAALSENVAVKAKEAGYQVAGTEGREQSEWVLVDLGSVIVHIMLAPVRAMYNLEELWNFKPGSRDEGGESEPDMSGSEST